MCYTVRSGFVPLRRAVGEDASGRQKRWDPDNWVRSLCLDLKRRNEAERERRRPIHGSLFKGTTELGCSPFCPWPPHRSSSE